VQVLVSREPYKKDVLAGHYKVFCEPQVPVVAFHLTNLKGENGEEKPRVYDEYDVMWRIREFRWMLPAYTFPNDCKCVFTCIRQNVCSFVTNKREAAFL
jgi:glutamate/tyrosine decarboxylase-like PLP-dependent enzyme